MYCGLTFLRSYAVGHGNTVYSQSFYTRTYFSKEYENLHVHFEDVCVGRRVKNASGAFMELGASSSDAFHTNMQQNLYFTVMFFQLHPFPTAGIPYFARLNKNTY